MDIINHNGTITDLTPPKESEFSTVMNGIGNGVTMGALPVAVMEAYGLVTDTKLPRALRITGMVTAGVGAIIGASFGLNEAKRLRQYRDTVNHEIVLLRQDVNTLQQTADQWQTRYQASQITDREPSPSL